MIPSPYFHSENGSFTLFHADCLEILQEYKGTVDMIFADPPYFLSNDGLTIQSGKVVSVNKGEWDRLDGSIHDFNYKWISACKEALKPDGTIWISGTMHNIFSIYQVLEELGFKILNTITWKKTNPPPCFSCRAFTSSTELIIWARKSKKVAHYFNYPLMKALNGGKQMKDVWELPAIARWEKACGKHPTQKPLSVLSRLILASTHPGALVMDPFTGSSTTGIACMLLGRNFIGIDNEKDYLEISKERYLETSKEVSKYLSKIYGLNYKKVRHLDL